jgi:hypothetical protein
MNHINGIREISSVNNLMTEIAPGKLKKKKFEQIGGKSRFDPLHLLDGMIKNNKFFLLVFVKSFS